MRSLFPDLIGNSDLRRRLGLLIEAERFPHALIIEGANGSGKMLLSHQIAAALVCERRCDSKSSLPCGVCTSCRKMLSDATPDLFATDVGDKTTIGVDAVREMRNDMYMSSTEFTYKVYIINGADKMTVQAQNALLKILEEPPTDVLILLLCESTAMLLETIKSRAQTVRMSLLDDAELDLFADRHEELSALRRLNPERYEALKKACDGCAGELIRLCDKAESDRVAQDYETVRAIVDAVTDKRKGADVAAALRKLSQKRVPLTYELSLLTAAFRDLCLLKRDANAQTKFFYDREYVAGILPLFTARRLFGLYDAVNGALQSLDKNANVALTLSELSVRMMSRT